MLKKRNILVNIFQKVPKNEFFDLFFFQMFAFGANVLPNQGLNIAFRGLLKSIWSSP